MKKSNSIKKFLCYVLSIAMVLSTGAFIAIEGGNGSVAKADSVRPNVSGIDGCIAYFTFDDLDANGGLKSLVANGAKTAKATVVGSDLSISDESTVGKSIFMPQGNQSNLTIKYDDNSSFLAGNDNLTISYWSRVPSAGSDTGWVYFGIDPNDDPANRNYIAMREKYDSIRPACANGANTSASTNLLWNSSSDIQGKWKFVTVVYSPTELTLYVDGVQKATRTNDTAMSTYLANSEFYIGFGTWTAATGNYEYYQGYVDEFAVMNKSYTAAQVKALYESYGFTAATPTPSPTPTPTRDPNAPTAAPGTEPNIANPSSLKDCIAYFTFDDMTADGGLKSKVSNGTKTAKATLIGSGPTAVDDSVRGKSLYMQDGDTGYFSVAYDDNSSFLAGQDELTISYYSKVPEGGAVGWLYFGINKNASADSRNYIAMREKASEIRPCTANGANTSDSCNLRYNSPTDIQGVWKHVTVVMTSTELTLYVNGEQVATRTNDKALSSYLNNSDFYIGYGTWASGEYFQGYIDEFAVMGTAYSAAEVKALDDAYSYTAPTPSPTPVVTQRPTRTPRATEPAIEDIDIPVATLEPPTGTVAPPDPQATAAPQNPNSNQPSNTGTNPGTNTGTTPGTNAGNNAQNGDPAIGSVVEYGSGSGAASYTVTAADEVEYKAPKSKAIKKVIIPASIKLNGKTYKVTSIAKKAFKGCKKLKNIVVKSKTLKKVGKAAFKGIKKKAVFKFPKAKFKAYKKLFKGKGQKKAKYKK